MLSIISEGAKMLKGLPDEDKKKGILQVKATLLRLAMEDPVFMFYLTIKDWTYGDLPDGTHRGEAVGVGAWTGFCPKGARRAVAEALRDLAQQLEEAGKGNEMGG